MSRKDVGHWPNQGIYTNLTMKAESCIPIHSEIKGMYTNLTMKAESCIPIHSQIKGMYTNLTMKGGIS